MPDNQVAVRKGWQRYRWMLLWLAALLSALCAARTSSALTVHLDEHDTAATVIVHTSDRLRVELPTAPATGFRWKAKTLDASHLQPLSKDVRPGTSGLTSPGTQVFVWKAISPGHVEIRLVYDRPGDKPETPGPSNQGRKENQISVDVLADRLTPENADSAIESPLVAIGSFKGTLPCATCQGIAVELTLFSSDANANSGTIFTEKWTYKGAGGTGLVHAGTGRWAVLHGTYADPSRTVYVIGSPFVGQENFALQGDSLIQLDGQMLPLKDEHGKEISLQPTP